MPQSLSAAKLFTISYRSRFEPEVHYRAYFTRCEASRFWLRVEQAYDKLVTNGAWDESEFQWVLTQLLRRTLPVTSRNMSKMLESFYAQAAPVHSVAALVPVRDRAAVRSLVADFNGIGYVEEEARAGRQ